MGGHPEVNEKAFGLAVRAVVLDAQGRCLLVRRSASNRRMVGQWEWPGGKVDLGETPDAAVRRELAEETGLEIVLTGFVGATSFEMPDIGLTVIVLIFKAAVTGGALTLSNEHDVAEWVRFSDFQNCELTEPVRAFMLDYATKQFNH